MIRIKDNFFAMENTLGSVVDGLKASQDKQRSKKGEELAFPRAIGPILSGLCSEKSTIRGKICRRCSLGRTYEL